MSAQTMTHEAVSLSIYSIRIKEVYEACKRLKDARWFVEDEVVHFQSAPGKAVARITNGRDILLIDLDVEENEDGTGKFSIPLKRLKGLSASSIDMVHFKAAENEEEITVLAENGETTVEESVKRCPDETLPGSGLLKDAEFHHLDEDEFLPALHEASKFTEDGNAPRQPLSAIHLDFRKQRIVATDKMRLYHRDIEFPITEGEVFLERTDFLAWDKLEGDTAIALLAEHIALRIGSYYYITKKGNHLMPDWEKVAKQKRVNSWRVGRDVQKLRDFMKSLPAKSKKDGTGISLSFTPGSVTVKEIDGDKKLRLKDSGIKFSGIVRVNVNYLLAAFNIGLDTINFGKVATNAIQFSGVDKNSHLYVAPICIGEAPVPSRKSARAGSTVKAKSKKTGTRDKQLKKTSQVAVRTREPVTSEEHESKSLSDDLTVQIFEERDWVWAKFMEKPDSLILQELKDSHFRWSRKRKAWYKKSPGIPAWLVELAHKAALNENISIEF